MNRGHALMGVLSLREMFALPKVGRVHDTMYKELQG